MNQKEETVFFMKAYINDHLGETLDLDRLSGQLHYSKGYLNRLFKERTNSTLHKYIKQARLERGAEKLEKTDLPVFSVALDVGYASQQAFATAFKKAYGCSPKEYRNQAKLRNEGFAAVYSLTPLGMCMLCDTIKAEVEG